MWQARKLIHNRSFRCLLLLLAVQAGFSAEALGQGPETAREEQVLGTTQAIVSEVPVVGNLISQFIEEKQNEVKRDQAALVRTSIDNHQSLASRISGWREQGYDPERIVELGTAVAQASAFRYQVLRQEAGDNAELQGSISDLHRADNQALAGIQIGQIGQTSGNLEDLSTRLGQLDEDSQRRFDEFRNIYTGNTDKLEKLNQATSAVVNMVRKNGELLTHTQALARHTQETQQEAQNQLSSLSQTTLSIEGLLSNLPTRADFEGTTATVREIGADTSYLATRERAREFRTMSSARQLEVLQDPARQQEYAPHLNQEQLDEQITVLKIQTTAGEFQEGLRVVQDIAGLFGDDGAEIARHADNLNRGVTAVAGLATSIAMGNPIGIITSVISISKLFGGSRRRGPSAEIQYLKRILRNQARLLEGQEEILEGQEEILDEIEAAKVTILEGQERLSALQIEIRDEILQSIGTTQEVIEWTAEQNQTYTQARRYLNDCSELQGSGGRNNRSFTQWNEWYRNCLNTITQVYWSGRPNRTYQIEANLHVSPGDAFASHWRDVFVPVVRLWGGLGPQNSEDPRSDELKNYMIPLVYRLAHPANKPDDISLKYFPDTGKDESILSHVTADYSYRGRSRSYTSIDASANIESCEGYDQLSCQFEKTLLHPTRVEAALNQLLLVIQASAGEHQTNEGVRPCTPNIRRGDQNQRIYESQCPKLYQTISRALQSLNVTIAQQSVLAGDILLPFLANLIFRYAPPEAETDYNYESLRNNLLQMISKEEQYSSVLRNNILLYEIRRQLLSARRLPLRIAMNTELPASEEVEDRNLNWKYNFLHYFLLYDGEQSDYDCSWDCILSLPIAMREGSFVVHIALTGSGNGDDNECCDFELPSPKLVYENSLIPTRRMQALLNKRKELFESVDRLFPDCQLDESSIFWRLPINQSGLCSPPNQSSVR